MTGARIDITVDDAEVQAAVRALARAGGNLGGAFRTVGEALLKSTRDRFPTQASPAGVPWTPISEAWRKQKAKRKHDPRILIMRGFLSGLRPGWLACQADADGVQVGTVAPYGAIHQFGGDINQPERKQTIRLRRVKVRARLVFNIFGFEVRDSVSRFASRRHKKVEERVVTIGAHTIHVPARPWLGLSKADTARILEIFEGWLTKAMAGGQHAT